MPPAVASPAAAIVAVISVVASQKIILSPFVNVIPKTRHVKRMARWLLLATSISKSDTKRNFQTRSEALAPAASALPGWHLAELRQHTCDAPERRRRHRAQQPSLAR